MVEWVHAAIAADRKVGALKQLQGHVWRTAFRSGKLVAQLFRWAAGSQRAAWQVGLFAVHMLKSYW